MTRLTARPGLRDSLTDVAGLRVGQAHDSHVRTGVTVVIPDDPVAMAVDVRGGGPGTRETEALNPNCLIDRVHGLVLSGGSVFGLAAADQITARLCEDGIGLDLGPRRVPVVPSAILFDLKNGGDKSWKGDSPYKQLADKAYDGLDLKVHEGLVGAGNGALAGAEPGGLGTASFELENGIVVSAIVAVNSFGCHMRNGTPEMLGQVDLPKMGLLGGNTTIGAVATNLDLDKAACQRLAIMAQDGLARSIRPIHTPFDGDTIFALSTGKKLLDEPLATNLAIVGTLAADALVKAVGKALAAAKI